MKIIEYKYRKENNYYSVDIKSTEPLLYNNLGQNDIFLKEVEGNYILKIRVKNKYPFLRILFKSLIPNEIWFSKFPNSDDIIIIRGIAENKSYKIYIIQNQWRYRFLFLELINTNPEILSSYNNKPI